MNLRSGVRLGPYEIVAPIGAGGMGEVYKARDTRLGRPVAIKILPAEFAQDAKFKVRFQREAKTISSLNHPHICTLHDVGCENDVDFLVLELCEGKTVAQRLESGPLPVEQVLEYGVQIAEALDKAHRKGIVHRDLKPSNVMLTKSGVKLLDFGLAKEQRGASPDDGSRTSTVDQPLTADTGIAGTLQYMAPETLSSGHVDARSDIYALGLVLYEMIGGRPAFQADSRAKLVAAILEREPEALPSSIDPDLAHAVARCILKDPDQRWQNAADIAATLRWLRMRPQPIASGKRTRSTRAAFAALIALLVLSTAAAAIQWFRRPKPVVQRRLSSIVIRNAPLAIAVGRSFAVAPDGRTIAFIGGPASRMYFRSSIDGTETEVPDSDRSIEPMFSPDNKWFGFSQVGKLKKLELATGDVRTIGEDGSRGANFVRAAWGDQDRIAFNVGMASISLISAAGGPLTELVKRTDVKCTRPSFLPGGRRVIFDCGTTADPNERTIEMLDIDTRRTSVLLKGGAQPVFSPTGHLLYVRTDRSGSEHGTIYSVGFDLSSSRVTTAPVPRVSDVLIFQPYPSGGRAHYGVDQDGSIYYVPDDNAKREKELVWLDPHGRVSAATTHVALYRNPNLSWDGSRVAYVDEMSVWVGDLARDSWIEVAQADFVQIPLWSSDDSTLAYEASTNGQFGIFTVPADGSKPPTVLLQEPGARLIPNAWSRDGRWLTFSKFKGGTSQGIWAFDLQTQRRVQLVPGPAMGGALISPQGHYVALQTNRTVQVQSFPQTGPRSTIANLPPCPPSLTCGAISWSRDGKSLLYFGDKRILSFPVKSSSGKVVIGEPTTILDQSGLDPAISFADVAPDGSKFLALRAKIKPRWDRINVLSGWWTQ